MVDIGQKDKVPQRDNYAEFTGKVETARAQLQARATSLNKSYQLVHSLLMNSARVEDQWKRRLNDLNAMVEAYRGDPEGYDALSELLATAQRMTSSSKHQSDLVRDRRDAIMKTQKSIETALTELQDAKSKLELSRYESAARENLNRLTSRASPNDIHHTDNDFGLQSDIAQARLAIASAEALVEIKDTRHG